MRREIPPPVSSRRFRAECQDCEDSDMGSMSIIKGDGRKVKRSANKGRMVNERWAWACGANEPEPGWQGQNNDRRLAAARRRD
jgi:hypothetical protein